MDRLGNFLEVQDPGFSGLGLAFPNPLRGQRLRVPSDVCLGDTPDGEPAILWRLPILDPLDPNAWDAWPRGGTAAKAFRAFLKLALTERDEDFIQFVRKCGSLGLHPYLTPPDQKIAGLD